MLGAESVDRGLFVGVPIGRDKPLPSFLWRGKAPEHSIKSVDRTEAIELTSGINVVADAFPEGNDLVRGAPVIEGRAGDIEKLGHVPSAVEIRGGPVHGSVIHAQSVQPSLPLL